MRRQSPRIDPIPGRGGPLPRQQAEWVPEDGRTRDRPSAAPDGARGETICPGSQCNRAFRRAEDHWAATGEDHDVPYHAGRPIWCESVYVSHVGARGEITTVCVHQGCTDLIAAALAELPRLLRDLPTSGPLAIAAPAERRGTASPPSPSPAFDELDSFARWLDDLYHRTSQRAGHSGRTRTPGRQLDYLAAWVSVVLAGPDAERDGQAILSWQRRLRSIVGAQSEKWLLPGTCSACDTRGRLRHRNGDDLVRCAACGAACDWDTYHEQIAGVGRDGGGESTRRTA